MLNNDPEINEIADEIKAYLSNYPNAADTVDGVRYWWLLGHRRIVPQVLVQQALDLLVANAAVSFKTNLSGTTVYFGQQTEIKR